MLLRSVPPEKKSPTPVLRDTRHGGSTTYCTTRPGSPRHVSTHDDVGRRRGVGRVARPNGPCFPSAPLFGMLLLWSGPYYDDDDDNKTATTYSTVLRFYTTV